MKKRIISVALSLALILSIISIGFNTMNVFAVENEPTTVTGSGLSCQWVNSSGTEVDVISLKDTSGTFNGTYKLKIMNKSSVSATVLDIDESVGNRASFSSTYFTLQSGETKTITVTKGAGLTSTPDASTYQCRVRIKYNLTGLYDASTFNSTNNTAALQTLYADTSIGMEYISAGNVANPYTLKNPAVGFEVRIKTKTTATGGWLETSSSDEGGTQNANVTGNYYVDISKYPTWQSAGWKIASTESKGNNLNVNSSSCSISGTYKSQGSISISFPNIVKSSTNTATPTGTIPTGSTTSTSAAVLNFYAKWKTNGWTGNNEGSLTGKINVYAYDKGNLRSLVRSCSQAGILSCYCDDALYTTYYKALGTAAQYLAKVKTNNCTINNYYTSLKTAYDNVVSSANRTAYCTKISNTTYGSLDRSGATTTKIDTFAVCEKGVATSIPFYPTYLNSTNRHSIVVTRTISANSSATYYYWSINETPLKNAINAANAITRSCCTEDSLAALDAAVESYSVYLNCDGKASPLYNTSIDSYTEKVQTAFDSLVYVHTEGEWTLDVAPTCITAGSQSKHCTVCGELLETESIDALGHDYTFIVTAPTCTEDGYTTYTCSRCDDTYKDEITQATGHDFGEWIVTIEPTCATDGTMISICPDCGAMKNEKVPATGIHTWGEWTVTTAPTTLATGIETRICDVCGGKETREVPMLEMADYSTVTLAIANAEEKKAEMIKTGYELDEKTVSALDNAISSIIENLDVSLQETVNSYAEAINQAADALDYAPVLIINDSFVSDEEGFLSCNGGFTDEDSILALFDSLGNSSQIKVTASENGYGTGTVIELFSDGKLVDSHTLVVFGDINGDSFTDVFDVAVLADLVNNFNDAPTTAQQKASDLCNDGWLDTLDLAIMVQMANEG